MPRLIRFLLIEMTLGTLMGAVFLTGLILADVHGLGMLLAGGGPPWPVLLAAGVSALGPFALCFMATAFAFHRWD